MVLVIGAGSSALAADEGTWSVGKSSGEVWMTTTDARQVSLSQEEVLKPGDTIRTGRNGRVLLVRGEETILVSPNSVIGLPTEKKDGLSTTIVQQAGSILLEVEKRNVKHFEVETPYLAAVVKGTQFSVTVSTAGTSISVIRGQVEVADFRSGQIAQIMPGQVATASAHGKAGLSLSGSGTFSPIEQGRPRASTIERIMVPKSGFSAPRHAANGLDRGLGHGVTRISASLGEVRLNFHKVTHGLAHGAIATHGSARGAYNSAASRAANTDTVWTSREASATNSGNGSNQGNSNDGGNSNGNAATAAAAAAGNGNSYSYGTNADGNGNGANGNGNGNGNGHGKENGHGNSNGKH
jgi:hypothetical protein